MSKFNEKTQFNIIRSYFKHNRVAKDQIDSFNDFVSFRAEDILSQEGHILVNPKDGRTVCFRMHNIRFGSPDVIEENRKNRKIFPDEARRRDLTYDSPIYFDIDSKIESDSKVITEQKRRVFVGRLPVMIGSELCNLSKLSILEQEKAGHCPRDPGGYFIVRGNERVIVSMVRANYNTVIVTTGKPDNKYIHTAEVRSMSNETGHSVLIKAMISRSGRQIIFSLPNIKQPVQAGIVFRALGFSTNEMAGFIGIDLDQYPDAEKYIRFLRVDSEPYDQKQALIHIGSNATHIVDEKHRKNYAWQIVDTELLPHLGVISSAKEKAIFLGHILRKLILRKIGARADDDRDNFANKRVDNTGSLIAELFRNIIKRLVSWVRAELEKRKRRPEIDSIFSNLSIITTTFQQCFSTGNWSAQRNSTYTKTGVSQILDRMTFGATLSHLRRLIIPGGKEGKNSDIRQIHGSQIGYICPAETPEGQKAGLVLNYTTTTLTTRRFPITVIRNIIDNECKTIVPIDEAKVQRIPIMYRIFVNNIPIGFSIDLNKTINELNDLRQTYGLRNDLSISYDTIDRLINIFCDEGRLIRPLIVLNNNTIPLIKSCNWSKLLESGTIRYVDVAETENTVIAMKPSELEHCRYDLCEIHPSLMLGIIASTIPWPDHSQSPRNCYQCSMGKQALGIPRTNFNDTTDTLLYVLNYPERPLVSTFTSRCLKFNDMPSGNNTIVAIAAYGGYNQEDSVIINQRSVDLGMFSVTAFRTITETEKKLSARSTEKICLPPQNSRPNIPTSDPEYFRRKNANYSLLNENGVIRQRAENGQGIQIAKGDVLIGKILVNATKDGKKSVVDVSRVVQIGEEGIVHKVYYEKCLSGNTLVKIVVRKIRRPVAGDKVASRAAQKGTIGIVMAHHDMPYVARTGIVPDIIINPLCIPSRMTINQLIETLAGTEACVTGKTVDCTPFTEFSTDVANKIGDQLVKHGFSRDGYERMINGMTGEMIRARIFVGVTYYQRLKHMVEDKIHARSGDGPVAILTRQPLEGRSRAGGLRFGEMERDCAIAQGAMSFLHERLYSVSDPFQAPICRKCGIMTNSLIECQVCEQDDIAVCEIPFAAKLLVQQLSTMISIRLYPKK